MKAHVIIYVIILLFLICDLFLISPGPVSPSSPIIALPEIPATQTTTPYQPTPAHTGTYYISCMGIQVCLIAVYISVFKAQFIVELSGWDGQMELGIVLDWHLLRISLPSSCCFSFLSHCWPSWDTSHLGTFHCDHTSLTNTHRYVAILTRVCHASA